MNRDDLRTHLWKHAVITKTEATGRGVLGQRTVFASFGGFESGPQYLRNNDKNDEPAATGRAIDALTDAVLEKHTQLQRMAEACEGAYEARQEQEAYWADEYAQGHHD